MNPGETMHIRLHDLDYGTRLFTLYLFFEDLAHSKVYDNSQFLPFGVDSFNCQFHTYRLITFG